MNYTIDVQSQLKFNPIVENTEKYTGGITDANWSTYLNIMKPRLELTSRIAIVCTEDVEDFDELFKWVQKIHEKNSEFVTEEPLWGTPAVYQFAVDMRDFEAIPFIAAMDPSAGVAAIMYNPLHAESMDKYLRREVLGEN